MSVPLTELDLQTASVWKPFADFVENYFNGANVEVPKEVFYYTTREIAQSICKTGEFWLFNIYDPASNEGRGSGSPDEKEVIAGIEIICEEIALLFNTKDGPHFREIASHFITDMTMKYRNVASIYMLCMSCGPNLRLWESKQEPGCVGIPDTLFEELCRRPKIVEGEYSTGLYFPGVVCYSKEDLQERIRPFCKRAIKTLEKAVRKFKPWETEKITRVKQRIIWNLGVALLVFSQMFKDSKFAYETEIRLLKIIEYQQKAKGETIYYGRGRIIETVDRSLLRLVREPPPHTA